MVRTAPLDDRRYRHGFPRRREIVFQNARPDGEEFPCPGVVLEVVPNRRLVTTDAFTEAWKPSEKPFMTTVVTFEPADGGKKTNYSARVLHWIAADREAHEKMGFHEGWSQCAEQLVELLAK